MGHTDSILDDFIALIFVCIFLYHLINAMKNAKHIDLNNLELFRILEDGTPEVSISVKNQTTQRKRRKKKKIKVEEKEEKQQTNYDLIKDDCIAAMNALGVKTKKEKEFLLNSVFSKHNPSTVEEFLKAAFV